MPVSNPAIPDIIATKAQLKLTSEMKVVAQSKSATRGTQNASDTIPRTMNIFV